MTNLICTFIVLLHPMAHKKHPTHKHSQKKSSKVSLAPGSKPPNASLPMEQADGSPKPIAVPKDSSLFSLRAYNIPDYRLEHPEFRIFMSGEGANLEYRVEGDLSAPPPPIRESKYLS